MSLEQTLFENNRRDPDVIKHYISEVLPSHFVDEYPKLISLLVAYYLFEDDEASPTKLLHNFYELRDITRVDESLLSFIEDEYLLGQSYFEGFRNKRSAAKFSNVLFKSKGTKYGIEQFFRQFFGVDPNIIYGRTFVFKVGEEDSQIGPISEKYLTNDKLIQQFGIQIKSEIAFSEWRDVYKLFTHPAGMYIEGAVQIVSQATIGLTASTEEGLPQDLIITSVADMPSMSGYSSLTGLVSNDNGGITRIDLNKTFGNLETQYDQLTVAGFDSSFSTLETFASTQSMLMSDSANMPLNSTIITVDMDKSVSWSADSDTWVTQIDSDRFPTV